jgi:hypothetical protein
MTSPKNRVATLQVPQDEVLTVHLSGPRNSWRDRDDPDKFPYIKLDVDMHGREVPLPGETIILNDGNTYKVESRMYWIDSDTESGWNEDVSGTGHLKAIHLCILPRDWEDSSQARMMKLSAANEAYKNALAAVHTLHNDAGTGRCLECDRPFPCATLRSIAPYEEVIKDG